MNEFEKKIAVMNSVFNSVNAITKIYSTKIEGMEYTKKRIFPNRIIPKRKLREIKKNAIAKAKENAFLSVMVAMSSAVQTSSILSQQTPKYPSGTKN